jgi:hypothetical protein
MSTTQPIVLEKHGDFNAKSFKPIAAKIWTAFFDLAASPTDLMHWTVDGFSSTVRVSGRIMDVNEYSPEWKTTQPIVAIVDGLLESMGPGETVPSLALRNEFREWVENGIMEAFASAPIKGKFFELGLSKGEFVIVTSPTDAGLAEDELKVLWASDKNITPDSIRIRQKEAQREKRRAVRKKK